MYVTAQALIDYLGEREALTLSDRQHTGQVNTLVLDMLLLQAEDTANGYIGRRYQVPLVDLAGQAAAAPLALQTHVMAIARYLGCGTEIMATEEIRNRYKDAISWLRDIMNGNALLGNLALVGSGGAAPTGGAWAVRTGDKTFGDLSSAL